MSREKATLLIVDDEPAIRKMVRQKFAAEGYLCLEATDKKQALDIINGDKISLVILNSNMPDNSSTDLLQEITTFYPDIAIIVAGESDDKNSVIQYLKQGVYDYITKPFNLEELSITVQRALENRRLIMENYEFRRTLGNESSNQAGKLQTQSFSAIATLVNMLEAKDKFTRNHSQRVSEIALAIARELGLPQETIDKIQLASLVHDLGNIGVKELILNKPSSLNADELSQARKHPELGEQILESIAHDEEILQMVRGHHERFDGSGYPDGLKGNDIPLGARIIAIAEAYEAMTYERPYRPRLSKKEALDELERCKNTQFDPEIVDTFLISRWWQRLKT
jgi:putative two-component system response regulator